MPFLFVDYDQGAGGEYFCANLSRSPQCQPLDYIKLSTNRIKVIDVFDQEFLKTIAQPQKVVPNPDLFDIVPAHRTVDLAEELLGKVYSIRIANPKDEQLWQYLKYQQIHKVFLSPLPSGKHLIGEIKMLMRQNASYNWIKSIKKNTDGLSIILLSRGIEPTEENKNQFIRHEIANKMPEPIRNYDLVIPYESLFYNTEQIKQDLKSTFNIDINDNWLAQYKNDYDLYCSKT